MRKNGKTIPHIAESIGVSKSSVSIWLRGITLPEKTHKLMRLRSAKNRLLAHEAKRQLTRTRLSNASSEAQALISSQQINPEIALIVCSLMYWCEGTKSENDSEFTFTNADPLIVSGFLALLRAALPLDENHFRVKMHLHKYHTETVQRKFWSGVTKIPETQFQNTFWKLNSGKNIKQHYQGCIQVRYHDVLVARKISATARNFLASPNVVR